MKAEEKIIELPTEYLCKTDRTQEEMAKHEKPINTTQQQVYVLQKQVEVILKQVDVAQKQVDATQPILLKHTEEIKSLQEESISLHKEGMKRGIQQDDLLKEIFSISKRVSDLEEKNKKALTTFFNLKFEITTVREKPDFRLFLSRRIKNGDFFQDQKRRAYPDRDNFS